MIIYNICCFLQVPEYVKCQTSRIDCERSFIDVGKLFSKLLYFRWKASPFLPSRKSLEVVAARLKKQYFLHGSSDSSGSRKRVEKSFEQRPPPGSENSLLWQ